MFEDPSKICIITDLDGTFLPKSKIPLERDLLLRGLNVIYKMNKG